MDQLASAVGAVMVGQVSSVIIDAGTIAAAFTAVLALFGVLSRWGPIASRIQAYRHSQEEARREAHAAVVTDVISTTVTPRLDQLTTTVESLDERLTAHMADELARFDTVSARLADHIENHPGPKHD